MKILVVGYHNPHFETITDYTEGALSGMGHTVISFDDRQFLLPGRVRDAVPALAQWDLRRLNRRLIAEARLCRPDLCLISGGFRILAETLEELESLAVPTVLWTNDPPARAEIFRDTASRYRHIFCAGSEAIDYLAHLGAHAPRLLPFACDPEVHGHRRLSEQESAEYGCDVAFVGTVSLRNYPFRVQLLEQLCGKGFSLGVWGPGSTELPARSPLRACIKGDQTRPETWTKIYSAAKIVLCLHYRDPEGKIACHQASPRIFEALSCGAFLMVDDQKDCRALFADGKHLVTFRDADLVDKVRYFLAHPEERAVIAACGREEVHARHTYAHRMREMITEVMRKHGS